MWARARGSRGRDWARRPVGSAPRRQAHCVLRRDSPGRGGVQRLAHTHVAPRAARRREQRLVGHQRCRRCSAAAVPSDGQVERAGKSLSAAVSAARDVASMRPLPRSPRLARPRLLLARPDVPIERCPSVQRLMRRRPSYLAYRAFLSPRRQRGSAHRPDVDGGHMAQCGWGRADLDVARSLMEVGEGHCVMTIVRNVDE